MSDSINKTPLQVAGTVTMEAFRRFRSLSRARQARLTVALAILVGCFAGLVWYATRTEWRTLYAGLEPDDARQMAQDLTAAGILFDVSADGRAIRVPAQNLDKARLTTTARGTPRSGRMGFELFDKPNWMGSEFDEQVNYQRALEGELEHTIDTLTSVQSARVHLVLPHDSLFMSQRRDAKASVVLRLRKRTLADNEADAISNLVSSAVDDLRPENVVLVNADGRGLLGRHGGDATQEAHEQQLAAKVVETLEAAAGVGNVRVSVNVDYDPGSLDETDETYDPSQTATLAMQRTEQTSGQPLASGIPGTASNAPGAKPPLYPASTESQQNIRQESGTYGVSRKVKHVMQPAGRIRRLTAAVLINYRRVQQGKQILWQPRSAEELKRLTDLAESAIGFDTSRGDQVSVEELSFDGNISPAEPPLSERLAVLAGRSGEFLRYGVTLILLAVFLIFVLRPILRSLTTASSLAKTRGGEPDKPSAQPEPRELSAEHGAAEQRIQRAQNVFEQVAEHVRREPSQSTRLIESWIRSE